MPDTAQAAADALTEYVRNLRTRAVAAGKASKWLASGVSINLYGDGTGIVTIDSKRCGSYSRPLAEAIAEAEEYIATDEVALANLTLGLTADGRLPEAEAA
jgi:hypothetical protein